MGLSYFFLKLFFEKLNSRLKEASFSGAISHTRNQLVIKFQTKSSESVFLNLDLDPGKESLSLRKDYHYPKINYAELFNDLEGESIEQIEGVPFERVFWIKFKGEEKRLIFKLFGRSANLIQKKLGKTIEVFNSGFKEDHDFIIPEARVPRFQFSDPINDQKDLRKQFPFLDISMIAELGKRGLFQKDTSQQSQLLKDIINEVERSPKFFLNQADKPRLAFYGGPGFETAGPSILEAFLEYEKAKGRYYHFKLPKAKEQKRLESLAKKQETRLEKLKADLQKKEEEDPFSKKADLLMANLHLFQHPTTEAEVEDFYTGTKILLKIKQGLSPQAQAERWYKKSKSRYKEIEHQKLRIKQEQGYLSELLARVSQIKDLESKKELDRVLKPSKGPISTGESLPFKREEFLGYEIRVGKSGAKNDELLRSWSSKDDLWLHVRDAPGSHVIIVNPMKKSIPNEVIERAAELAVQNSKRKGEENCPVISTQRKYVRKKKGSPPGQVVVEKESILFS